ncbi:class I SAM-dependent methyltransferase [Clostridium sp. 19966]|uniref:class I SAM-dependent methyltransferase n=1 Tax=Clostridium sp. 19966 TaxID=2768166 RepID=UPI0028DE364A|nr:class I SAM-dependent methyltransferase [Clostridium sp. 19966]MDT8719273.1 class I SAM-dependent methyltransferase [Clostridium sp. 19966]
MHYNPENTKKHYNKYGNREWERLEKDRLGDLLYQVHLDILKRHISKSDSVIELGAGAGRFTKDIVNLADSLVTSDLSPVQIEINKNKMEELGLADKVKAFVNLDISNLESIESNTYDVAVCIGGPINYLFDKEENAINEMLRILKPKGKLILGSMSLVGALMYYLGGVIYEKGLFGIDATEWIFSTGLQDEEHYPVANKHYVHMMTSKDLDALFQGKSVKILEKSSAGLFMHSQEETLSKAKEDDELWELLIRKEIEFTKLPGTLDCGMNIIYVVEKL